MPPVRIAVVADTHVPRRARDLPPSAWRLVESSDLLVHAGDVVSADFLTRLRAHARVLAVRGNNDHGLDLPGSLETAVGGVLLAVLHDAGPAAGRRRRLARRFPGARVAVFGHSHVPLLEDDGDLLLLNPGSPTDRRRMPTFTMARLDLAGGRVARAELVDLGLERA